MRVLRFPIVAVVVLSIGIPAAALARSSRAELTDRVERAAEVFREVSEMPDRRIPQDLMARSRCIAVVPNVIKAAWIVGGRHGRGVLTCRSNAGEWSPPVHVRLTGGSFGLQAGASSTDVVLFFMTTASVRSLLSSKVKLSGEAGVAAGPVGRETEAATDGRFTAEIYSYARSRGLFAGLSVAGGFLGVDAADTDAYYGQSLTPSAVLFDRKVTKVPRSAWTFLGVLPKPAPGKESPAASGSAKPQEKTPQATTSAGK